MVFGAGQTPLITLPVTSRGKANETIISFLSTRLVSVWLGGDNEHFTGKPNKLLFNYLVKKMSSFAHVIISPELPVYIYPHNHMEHDEIQLKDTRSVDPEGHFYLCWRPGRVISKENILSVSNLIPGALETPLHHPRVGDSKYMAEKDEEKNEHTVKPKARLV